MNPQRLAFPVTGPAPSRAAMLLALLATPFLGWWLFADTIAHHAPSYFDDPATIRFAHFGSYQDYQLWKEVIDRFEDQHQSHDGSPAYRVRQEYVVGLANHYNTKMRQQILAKSLPHVALVQLGPYHELASHFTDLTAGNGDPDDDISLLLSDLHPKAVKAFLAKGQQRALPISGGSLQIYLNTNCLTRAGKQLGRPLPPPNPDWTQDDFLQLARDLTCDFDNDGRNDQFGFWLPRWLYFLPFAWSSGAAITDESVSQWKFFGTEAEEALTLYRRLAVEEGVCPRPGEVPQLFQDTGFLTGKVAMCVNGPWFLPFLSQTNLADSFVVLPIPSGRAGRATRVTWDGIVMRPDLPKQQRIIARRFIRFVLSKEIQDLIAQTGRAIPARIESMPAFEGTPPAPARQSFVDALAYARTQPLTPHFGTIDRAINRHLTKYLLSDLSTDAATVLAQLRSDPSIKAAFNNAPLDSP